MKCTDCRFCIFQMQGPFTAPHAVDFQCAAAVHPDGVFESKPNDPRLDHADLCYRFLPGLCIIMDDDAIEYAFLTEEQRKTYDERVL